MILTATNFAVIRQFVLRDGDRQTYCNMYNDNPHWGGAGFEVFLNPEDGQRNINCDPAMGGFDTMVIQDGRKGAWGPCEVQLSAEKLRYDKADEAALEYYFAALLSAISHAP